MNTPYTPTEEDIKAAHVPSFRRFGYPPVKEAVTITLDTHPSWSRDGTLISFVRMSAIPERFHEAVKKLGRGSACPSIDEKHDALYEHDVYRWLRSIGVEAEFIEPSQP